MKLRETWEELLFRKDGGCRNYFRVRRQHMWAPHVRNFSLKKKLFFSLSFLPKTAFSDSNLSSLKPTAFSLRLFSGENLKHRLNSTKNSDFFWPILSISKDNVNIISGKQVESLLNNWIEWCSCRHWTLLKIVNPILKTRNRRHKTFLLVMTGRLR
jgi:hypothetical protein